MDGMPDAVARSSATDLQTSSALPSRWNDLWGSPPREDALQLEWHRLRKLAQELAEAIPLIDRSAALADLVGAADLTTERVHRWFGYKEGFSPRLLGAILDHLGVGHALRVADPFGGVATTALAGMGDRRVSEIRSVEYSPLAHFVGRTKLSWPTLDSERLRRLLPTALSYPNDSSVDVPALSAFANPAIFHPKRLHALLRARDHLRRLPRASTEERDFFLLGLAAVVEDLSGAMKDGRALRILGDRRRRPSSLGGRQPAAGIRGAVKRTLAGQWEAMISDVEALTVGREAASGITALHLRGDARALHAVEVRPGEPAFPNQWADVACFSPPYLNCIDYTEVHKLELWLMELVTTHAQFRETRLGTLRSHPSVRFPETNHLDGITGALADFIEGASGWVKDHGARSEVGPIVKQYFEDMFEVWKELHRTLKRDAVAVCVVANSTFSRRNVADNGVRQEAWRLPVLTDVLLAHLAAEAGFARVEIWHARELRPRNVRAGRARESAVVAWNS